MGVVVPENASARAETRLLAPQIASACAADNVCCAANGFRYAANRVRYASNSVRCAAKRVFSVPGSAVL